MDPVEAKGLSGVLLVDKRDRLAVDNTVVALDDQVLASTTADEFRSVVSEPELCSERMAVVLPSGPAGTSGQSRLEDVRRMRPPPRQVPLVPEPGEEQLRLVSREHRPALIVRA
jgi:hypothetical protein